MNVLEMVRAAKEIGPDLAKGQMFGLSNESQGVTLAMLSFQSGQSLEYYRRTFHVIEGKMTMRSDAMLAGLVELGGKYRVVKRDEDGATIEISARGETRSFDLPWLKAQAEPFTKGKDNKVAKNYSTPLKRSQMLWARVVSDGVRTMDPRVNAGFYTPEEMDADLDESNFAEVAAPEPKANETIDLGSGQVKQQTATTAPVASAPAETPAPVDPAPAIEREKRTPVDQQTVDQIKALIVSTGVPVAQVLARLQAAGMSKLAEMTLGDAQQLKFHLQEKKSLDEWLALPLEPPGN